MQRLYTGSMRVRDEMAEMGFEVETPRGYSFLEGIVTSSELSINKKDGNCTSIEVGYNTNGAVTKTSFYLGEILPVFIGDRIVVYYDEKECEFLKSVNEGLVQLGEDDLIGKVLKEELPSTLRKELVGYQLLSESGAVRCKVHYNGLFIEETEFESKR